MVRVHINLYKPVVWHLSTVVNNYSSVKRTILRCMSWWTMHHPCAQLHPMFYAFWRFSIGKFYAYVPIVIKQHCSNTKIYSNCCTIATGLYWPILVYILLIFTVTLVVFFAWSPLQFNTDDSGISRILQFHVVEILLVLILAAYDSPSARPDRRCCRCGSSQRGHLKSRMREWHDAFAQSVKTCKYDLPKVKSTYVYVLVHRYMAYTCIEMIYARILTYSCIEICEKTHTYSQTHKLAYTSTTHVHLYKLYIYSHTYMNMHTGMPDHEGHGGIYTYV